MRFTKRYVRQILVHIQREDSKQKEESEHYGYCITWYQFSSLFKPYGVKVLSFLIQKFALSLNLNFSVLLVLLFIFRSCSIIINWLFLLNICSMLLKCLHASMAFDFFMSFLWLFSLILNNASDFPTYWILHMTRF